MILSRHILPLLMLIHVVPSLARLDLDDDSIRRAVDAWLEDPEDAKATYGAIEDWNTWQVTDMSRLFQGAENFTADLNDWDTSDVTDMHHMFAGCAAFDSPLDQWDVRHVTDFSQMFYGASSFTGESLDTWDTSSATKMEQMFLGASDFVGPENIDKWNTTSVTSMYAMFFHASSFDRSINAWNMTNVRNTNSLMEGASSFSQKICWPHVNPHAKCFQCFCGTSDASFDTSDECRGGYVHPSILAYSQACDPDDLLEDLVESQVFTRPNDGEFLGGLRAEDTGNFVEGVAGLPSLGSLPEPVETPEEERGAAGAGGDAESSETEAAGTGGDPAAEDRLGGEDGEGGDFIPIGASREVSSASAWRSTGLLPLLALVAAVTRIC